MATLLEKCNNIKNDKKLNLKPENLKAGVVCLGVTGILDVPPINSNEYDLAIQLSQDILGPIYVYCDANTYTEAMKLDGNYVVNDIIKIDKIIVSEDKSNWITVYFTNLSTDMNINSQIVDMKIFYENGGSNIAGAYLRDCAPRGSATIDLPIAYIPDGIVSAIALQF